MFVPVALNSALASCRALSSSLWHAHNGKNRGCQNVYLISLYHRATHSRYSNVMSSVWPPALKEISPCSRFIHVRPVLTRPPNGRIYFLGAFLADERFCPAGFLLFKEYCEQCLDEPVPQLSFYEEVSELRTPLWSRTDGQTHVLAAAALYGPLTAGQSGSGWTAGRSNLRTAG